MAPPGSAPSPRAGCCALQCAGGYRTCTYGEIGRGDRSDLGHEAGTSHIQPDDPKRGACWNLEPRANEVSSAHSARAPGSTSSSLSRDLEGISMLHQKRHRDTVAP